MNENGISEIVSELRIGAKSYRFTQFMRVRPTTANEALGISQYWLANQRVCLGKWTDISSQRGIYKGA